MMANRREEDFIRKARVRKQPIISSNFGVETLRSVLRDSARRFYSMHGPFLASGLAFDLLLNFIPLLFLIVSTLGYTLAVSDGAIFMVQSFLKDRLPAGSQFSVIDNLPLIASKRNRFGLTGFVLYLFFTTATVGSVRTVLNNLFEIKQSRSFFRGKAVDLLVMLMASGLFVFIAGLSALVAVARTTHGIPLLGIAVSRLLGLLFTAALLYLLYRFCPAQRIARRGLWTAVATGAVLLELSKRLFGWYISVASGYTILYGALSGFLFLCLWLYYVSLIFILSAVIGSSVNRIGTAEAKAAQYSRHPSPV